MDFIKLFFQSLTLTSSSDSDFAPHTFMTNFYNESEECPKNLLHLLADGMNAQDCFFAFSFRPMDCCLILYTKEGIGELTTENQTYDLSENSLLFLDCRRAFSIQSSLLPWKFKLYFIGLDGTSTYQSVLIPGAHPLICKISPQSSVLHFINMLSNIPECYSMRHAFSMHRYLTELFCALIQMVIPNQDGFSKEIPFYLTDLKRRLENHYTQPFLLADYEQYYKISRYRLCREFSAQFGRPPLQFLNHRRLDVAKEMLLTSDFTISEISSRVGYETTAHFINLFKKNTGVTPSAFRKEPLVDPDHSFSSSQATHSPAKS